MSSIGSSERVSRFAVSRMVRAVGLMRPVNQVANWWFWCVKRLARLRNVSDIDAVYSQGYFEAETNMTEPTAAGVVDSLLAEFSPSSVSDVGCGTAVYLRAFQQRGLTILGYEGSSNALRHALVEPIFLRQQDLRQPLVPFRKYDLVTSFEVGEHLDKRDADTFVANIVSLGDTIAFSAAQPGQGGTDHINEQPAKYWIEKFARQGCTYNSDRTSSLRARFRERKCVWWLQVNVLVFEKRDIGSN